VRKIILISIFLFCIFVNTSFSNISKYFGSSKLSLDETGVINFFRYLNGTFHSENNFLDRARNLTPMYYAISKDGKVGYGWFCESHIQNDCYDNFLAFKIVEFCQEYAKEKCAIFAIKNEIVWNKSNIVIDKLDFDENIEILKKLNFYDNTANKFLKINKNNYLDYVNLQKDKCSSQKDLVEYFNLRGASLNCLLPGRYELRQSDLNSGRD